MGSGSSWDQELRDVLLAAVPHDGAAAAEVTAALTRAMLLWAGRQGWASELEVPVSVARPFHDGRLYAGYLDVVLHRPDRPLAIELDRADKRWSLDKLLSTSARGWDAAWVRWGQRSCQLDVPAPVVLLNVPVRYERGRVPTTDTWRAPRRGRNSTQSARRLLDEGPQPRP